MGICPAPRLIVASRPKPSLFYPCPKSMHPTPIYAGDVRRRSPVPLSIFATLRIQSYVCLAAWQVRLCLRQLTQAPTPVRNDARLACFVVVPF